MVRGLTTGTPNNLLLGAGAFYKGWVVGTDTPATAASKLLGATDGGGSFAATPAIRQVSVDGAPGPVMGLEVIDGWTATLTANVKEVTAANLELAVANFTEATVTDGKKITTGHDIESTDYADNITWVGSVSGKTKPVIIVLKNALSMNGISISFQDKNEAIIPLTITAHYDLSDLETPPFEIIYPTT